MQPPDKTTVPKPGQPGHGVLLQVPPGPTKDPLNQLLPATALRSDSRGERGRPRGGLRPPTGTPRGLGGVQGPPPPAADRTALLLASPHRSASTRPLPPPAAGLDTATQNPTQPNQAGPEETRATRQAATAPLTPPTGRQPLPHRRLWQGGGRRVPAPSPQRRGEGRGDTSAPGARDPRTDRGPAPRQRRSASLCCVALRLVWSLLVSSAPTRRRRARAVPVRSL